MTHTAEHDHVDRSPYIRSNHVVSSKQATNEPDEKPSPSFRVTPPSVRRRRTGAYLPGFGFETELQRAVKSVTDTLTTLDSLNESVFREKKLVEDYAEQYRLPDPLSALDWIQDLNQSLQTVQPCGF